MTNSGPLTAVKLSMLHSDKSIDERFATLRSMGLDGVELSLADAAAAAAVARAARASGLRVATLIVGESFSHSLTSEYDSQRAVVVDAILRNLEYASGVGADALMFSPGFADPETTIEVCRGRVDESLASVSHQAELAGVRLGIENLWNGWLLSPRDLAHFVDELGLSFGVHFDIGNAMRYGWPEHWIDVLDHRIIRLDIKDFSSDLAMTPATRYGLHEELVAVWGPGPWGALDADLLAGDVAWSRVAARLSRIHYRGWMCAEVAGGDSERLSAIAGQLDVIRDLVASHMASPPARRSDGPADMRSSMT